MRISVIGTGYVGLVTGACLADVGNHVLCLDKDPRKIAMLREGTLPIYEPGLLEIVQRNVEAGRLQFTTDVATSAQFGALQFIAVGTPMGEDGSADVNQVLGAARDIGMHMTAPVVVINKSTVPVGTAAAVETAIREQLDARDARLQLSVASNPEFLKEGAAIADFMRPDRIVLGCEDAWALQQLRDLYAPFQRNHDRIIVMNRESSELTKYAANAMLATRISFMNELARLCDKVGADIDMVRRGIGSDARIGRDFLYAGCGYGGSCFPKDVRALIHTGSQVREPLGILAAVEAANEQQKTLLGRRVVERFGESLDGRRFAVWGLAFKPNTDDMREAPSIPLITELLGRGAIVNAYDPVAAVQAAQVFGSLAGLTLVDSAQEAVQGADALLVVTEWREFQAPDWAALRAAMRTSVIVDGRNLYDPEEAAREGFEYSGIGRGRRR